ncbi:hypothetical protein COO60DRAFT_1706290 [Scenedesmus sp. NREL 46B-D3]|nr:hypothetical protein COO60DRAFT_1706290 [Scenedesmus sp. NREL 46B-D3]
MLQEGSTDKFEYYAPGTFVSVNLPSKEGLGRGDAYAPSIARIEAVFEDARGCCHVALRYFWRWGQIHAGADLHRAMRPRFRAQLFLQKEITLGAVGSEGRHGQDSHNTLRYADGRYKELLPAIQLNERVTVLSKAGVVRGFGRQHADPAAPADVAAALGRYEANWSPADATDPDNGARSNGFWFDTTFDQTCYKFEAATPEDLPDVLHPGTRNKQQQRNSDRQQQQQQTSSAASGAAAPTDGAAAGPGRFQRLPKELGLTMGDAFCGLGTVSIAANEVGWQVEYGIDSSRDAMASFRANTAHSTAAPFNAVTDRPPVNLPPLKVEQVVEQLRSGMLALPAADWVHLSPPCQNVSQKKKLEDRVFSGAELRSAVELVELLKPSFVTLEEVPGFLVQRFLPHNLTGVLAGYPNAPSAPQHSTSSTPGAAAAAGASHHHDKDHADEVGCEADSDDEEDDDQEGEGLSDEDQATAAAADSSRSSAGGAVLLNPVLLVVPALLDLGYQLRLCLLNAACYGAPQIRHRVVLLAAKQGCQLPEPPRPRYAVPGAARCLPRLAVADTGFLCKNDGAHGDWLEEACGDLPPLTASCLRNAAAAADQQCCSGARQGGTAAGSQQQQQTPCAARASRQPAVWLGEDVMAYRPESGLMNCPLPLEALQQPGCRPVSLFSRWARSACLHLEGSAVAFESQYAAVLWPLLPQPGCLPGTARPQPPHAPPGPARLQPRPAARPQREAPRQRQGGAAAGGARLGRSRRRGRQAACGAHERPRTGAAEACWAAPGC